jgi:hypothetical protein
VPRAVDQPSGLVRSLLNGRNVKIIKPAAYAAGFFIEP